MANKNFDELTTAVMDKLKELHYADDTLRHYQTDWNRFKSYLDEQKIALLDENCIETYFMQKYGVSYHAPCKEHTRTMRQTMRSLRVLLDYQSAGLIYRRRITKDHTWPECFVEAMEKFMNYASQNYSRTTVRQYRSHSENFTQFLLEQQCCDFNSITPELIKAYLKTRATLSKKSRAYDAYVLRSLFDYLYDNGYCTIDYSVFIPRVKINSKGGIPAYYTTEELTKLLASIDRANPVGKRDYAILLLAIRYGMRVGDIRNLELSSFDWNNSRLNFIQAKTGQAMSFQLLPDVATAIIDYFQHGRPATDCRKVFVRHNAPYDEFGADDNLHYIISKYLNLAGIQNLDNRKHGLHTLRHSIAGTLLEQGVPMPTVSEVLGHTSTETTMIYTKISVNQLSGCALEVD